MRLSALNERQPRSKFYTCENTLADCRRARLVKIKQDQAKSIGKRGKALGRMSPAY